MASSSKRPSVSSRAKAAAHRQPDEGTGTTGRLAPAGKPSGSGDAPSPEPAKERPSARRRPRRWPWVVVGVFLLAVLAAGAAFSWDRWFRFDDAQDMRGTWQVAGSSAQVVIDDEGIHLATDVSYAYELDAMAKTVVYTFSNLSGQGHYRFSSDRQVLVIADGEYVWSETLFEDAVWTVAGLVDSIQGREPVVPSGENLTVLTKVSDSVVGQVENAGSVAPADGAGQADGTTSTDGAEQAQGDAALTGDRASTQEAMGQAQGDGDNA